MCIGINQTILRQFGFANPLSAKDKFSMDILKVNHYDKDEYDKEV